MRRFFLNLLACGSALALLAGCASSDGLVPVGRLTDVGALHAEKSLAAAVHNDAAWPAADWWRQLGDPQLDALIDEALAGNPDVDAARARVRAAAAASEAQRAALGLQVAGAASIAGARLPGTVLPAPIGGHFGWMSYGYASFKWDPDLWGGQRAAWAAAVGQQQASAVDVQAARLMVSTAVARAYAQFGNAGRQQALATQELQRARQAQALTAERLKAGLGDQLALQRSDAEVALDERQLAGARQAVAAARIEVAVLLGQGPDRGLALTVPAVLTPARLALPPDLPAELLGRRPDLVAARWRVEAARSDIAAAKAKFLPNISLGALAGLAAKGSETLLSLPARFYEFGPALSLPIFDSGRLRANLAGRDAAYDAAVAHYNQTLVAALGQVADQTQALQGLAAQVAAQQQSLAAARAAERLAEQRYRAGVGSFLDALDVRRDLLQAEQGLAALQAQQLEHSIELVAALGGGYRAVESPRSQPLATAPAHKAQEARHE